jgi:hypothetical protein
MSMHLSFIIIFKIVHFFTIDVYVIASMLFSCLWEFLCMSCKRSPQKIPYYCRIWELVRWCETLMWFWFISSLGHGWCFNECHIDNYNGIILCPHHWPSPNAKPNECRNPNNQYGTLCTCMSCNVFVHVLVT